MTLRLRGEAVPGRIIRVRLTVRRLMIAVAFAGLCLPAFRLHHSLGFFLSAVVCLALIRTYEMIDRSRAAGQTMSRLGMARTLLTSGGVASAILMGSFLPALIAYEFTFESIPTRCNFPTEIGEIVREQSLPIIVAALVALPCASLLKQVTW